LIDSWSKYQKNYERTNAEKELRALSGVPPAIVAPSRSTMLRSHYNHPYSAATYLDSPDYYSGGAGALVPAGSFMPSGYRQQYSPFYPAAHGNFMPGYQTYPHSYPYYMGQQPYTYGYGQPAPYAGMNGAMGMQPYYPPQMMMPYSAGYQRAY